MSSVLGLSRLSGPYGIPLAGFAGALVAIFLLQALSSKRGVLSVQGLLLVGVMLSFICSSLVLLIMSVSRIEDLHGILFWIIGSLGETDWFLVKLALAAAVTGLILSYFFCFDLNALSLGEDEALHLGINVERTKKDIVHPHVARHGTLRVPGRRHRVRRPRRPPLPPPHRRPTTASSSSRPSSPGPFSLFCRTRVARTVALPIELPVGVVTGIVGGVLFIYALTGKTRAGGL